MENGEEYIEFGQVYKGGNDVMFFANNKAKTNKQDYSAITLVTVNTVSLTLNGSLIYQNNFQNADSNLTVNFESKPYSGNIDSAKPSDAISIREALRRIGLQDELKEIDPLQL